MTNQTKHTKGEKMKVYRRKYDGKPVGFSSKEQPNEFLGEFKIKKTLMEDSYAGRWVGEKDGKDYLIIQTEVSGMYNPKNGGSRFEIEEL